MMVGDEEFFVNCKQLIAEVRKRPILYNGLAPNYYNRTARDDCWLEIYKVMVPNWDVLSVLEQDNCGMNIRRKWRSIRDAFTKDYRKRSHYSDKGKKRSRPYVYYNHLLFLIPTLQKRGPLVPVLDVGENPPSPVREDDSDEFEASSNATAVESSKEEDEDKLFLLSLLPLYRTVREDSKLISRIKMLEFVRGLLQDGAGSKGSSRVSVQQKKQSGEDVVSDVFDLQLEGNDDVKNEPSSPIFLEEDPLSLQGDEAPTPSKKARMSIPAKTNIPTSTTPTILVTQGGGPSTSTSDDIFEAIGKNVAHKLRSMIQQQRIIAEKIVGDVMYHGQMESLTVDSHLALHKNNSEKD